MKDFFRGLGKNWQKSNMKRDGVHVATVGYGAFGWMLFSCGNHVVYLTLLHDSYVPGKSTFPIFWSLQGLSISEAYKSLRKYEVKISVLVKSNFQVIKAIVFCFYKVY